MRILFVSSTLAAGRYVCAGLEVLDAGGSDDERMDFARAEAADIIASDLDTAEQLPARVQLLPDRLSYLDGGGSLCGTRGTLVEALKTRLANLKPGWRIEGRGRDRGIFSVREEERTLRNAK